MYCMNCGTKNPDGAKYCNNCGRPMNSVPSDKKKKSGVDWGYYFALLVLLGVAVFVVNFVIDGIGGLFSGKDSSAKTETKTGTDSSWFAPAQPEAAPVEEPNYIEYLDGTWEEVHLKDGNSNLNVSALRLSQTVYNCTSFTVNIDVTMNAGTSCKDWNVWIRSGGSFTKVGKVHLPEGNGFGYQTLYFDTPISFDSVAVTPTAVGGYSWSMSLSITDILTK